MTNKLKLLIATSLVAFVTTGCSTAPAPWAQSRGGGGTGSNGVTHSHNGIVHTHPLPSSGIHHSHKQGGGSGQANTNRGGGSNNQGGVAHSHDGVTHTHPLPASGLHHRHGNGGYGQGGSGSNNGRGGSYTDPYYDGYDNSRNGSGYYDDEFGRNSGSRYDDSYGGSRSSYDPYNRDYGNDYGRDRNADRSYGNDRGYDYGRSSGSSSSSDSDYSSSYSSSADDYDGGDYYTVQRKDTVFQVMRNTGAYWKDIIRLNNLKAPKYEIHPGQRLKLPKDRDHK